MTDEQSQLIAAAIIETAGGKHHLRYTGNLDDLIDRTMDDWFGAYSRDDALESLNFLKKLNVIDRSSVASTSSFIRIDTGEAVFKLREGSSVDFNPRQAAPLLYEYAQFGRPWLEAMWPHSMLGRQAAPIGGSAESGISEYERALAQIIPAADRSVRPDHNLPDYVDALEKVQEARRLIEQSNQLSEEEKSDTLVHLDAGLSILARARNFTVGAIHYLILDRLKKAFEGAIEDAFKIVIVGAFMTLATVLIWMIGQ